MPLPIERSDTVNGRDHGEFQVFAEARGFGFAFRPVKYLYPYPNPKVLYVPDRIDPPSRYEAKYKVILDLKSTPPPILAGRVVDGVGSPSPASDSRSAIARQLTFNDDSALVVRLAQ